MKRAMIGLVVLSTLALTACGVDGEPEPPTRAEAAGPGISLTGNVSVGVGGTF